MALLEEKMRKKRQEREEQEKQEALDRERIRIRSGKDLSEAQRKMEEMEMKKLVEQRKREKDEEKMARERVRAQIESDKAARRAKMAELSGQPTSPPPVVVPVPTVSAPVTPKEAKNYSNTKIQFRLLDGSTVVETFDVKETLSAVRLFVQLKQGLETPFKLMTTFPRKIFGDDDFEKPLEALGLVPSAVLVVSKA